MFNQLLRNIIERAIEELYFFKPDLTENYTRDSLIELYWKFYPRFISFKVFSTQNASALDIGSGSGDLFYRKEYLAPCRTDMKMTALDLPIKMQSKVHVSNKYRFDCFLFSLKQSSIFSFRVNRLDKFRHSGTGILLN